MQLTPALQAHGWQTVPNCHDKFTIRIADRAVCFLFKYEDQFHIHARGPTGQEAFSIEFNVTAEEAFESAENMLHDLGYQMLVVH